VNKIQRDQTKAQDAVLTRERERERERVGTTGWDRSVFGKKRKNREENGRERG
jgi:hypothetical protein